MERTLRPELLDSLSPDDPAAVHNRRDLRLINAFLGTRRWFLRELSHRVRPGERILEVGAGTGELAQALRARGYPVDGLDLWPQPRRWPAGATWHRTDLLEFNGYGDYPVVIGNLIFHQFTEFDLRRLGEKLRGARVLVAAEPARKRRAQALIAAGGWLFGANYVTRHDARVSIQAGFLRDELPRFLGLERNGWSWNAAVRKAGVYRLTAERA